MPADSDEHPVKSSDRDSERRSPEYKSEKGLSRRGADVIGLAVMYLVIYAPIMYRWMGPINLSSLGNAYTTVVPIAITLTAVCFIVGGALLTMRPPLGSQILLICALLGIILTAASVYPLWYGSLHAADMEMDNGYDHPMAFLNGVAFIFGAGVDVIQLIYCTWLANGILKDARSNPAPAV